MVHIGVVISYLPPPILNLKPPTSTASKSSGSGDSGGSSDKNELQEILINTFEENGLNFKRQNSIETDRTDLAIADSEGLSTDAFPDKLTIDTPLKAGYIKTKEMELKKGYYDSFNDDLLELHAFTLAFSKQLSMLTSVIK